MKKNILIILLFIAFIPLLHAKPETLEKFLGTYKFVGDDTEKQELNRAVNRFIHQIPFLVRSFYKSSIRKGFPLPEEIKIIRNKKGQISIDASLKTPVFSDLNKTPVRYKNPDGKATELQRKLIKSKILEKFTDDRGLRLNSYKFSPSGLKMIYTVKFTSKRLRNPVWFKLSYEKINMERKTEKK